MAALLLISCQQRKDEPPPPTVEAERAEWAAPGPELSEAFLERATRQLALHLRPESELLDLRATGTSFSVQMRRRAGKPELVQLDYVERPKGNTGQYESRIYGPTRVTKSGDGKLKDNLFLFSEIKLGKIARSFRVAKLAVDPQEGQIERLIVRRFLPFSDRVRARIYVRSPRLPGSIDTNEEGTPLRR